MTAIWGEPAGGQDPASVVAAEAQGSEVAVPAEPPAPYVVSLALQRGPFPYEQRTTVIAAVDAETEREGHPEGWAKAVRRAHKEGGEVRFLRIALDADRVGALFDGLPGVRGPEGPGGYRVRLALCEERPPVVVAAVDEEMAEGMGIDLGGPLMAMPMFYRRLVARAFGEVREVVVSVPRSAVDAAFEPRPVEAAIAGVLSVGDPRF